LHFDRKDEAWACDIFQIFYSSLASWAGGCCSLFATILHASQSVRSLARSAAGGWGLHLQRNGSQMYVCAPAFFFVFRSHRVFRTRGVSVRESERVSFALLRRNNVAAGSKKNCVSSTHISLSPLHFHISLPRQGERGEIACTRAAWSEPLMLCSLFPNSSFRGDRCPVPQITFQSDICLGVGSGT